MVTTEKEKPTAIFYFLWKALYTNQSIYLLGVAVAHQEKQIVF